MDISKKIKLCREDIYVFLIGIVTLQDAMNSSELLRPFLKIVKYPLLGLILALMFFLIWKTKDSIKAWILFGVMFILALNTAKTLSTNAILYISILSFLSRKQNVMRGAKAILLVMGSVFFLHISLFLFNYIFSRSSLLYLEWHGLLRYNIYYDHPNNAAKYFIFICVLIVNQFGNKMRLRHWNCILVAMALIYYFTHSEAVFIVVILFCLYYFRSVLWIKRGIEFTARYGMLVAASVSACCALVINIPVISKGLLLLDTMGSERFSNLFRAVRNYGITFFGQNVVFGNYQIVGGYDSIYADNFTVYCMTYLGIVYILVLCILFYLASEKMDLNIKVWLCMFIIFSLFENRVLGIEAYAIVLFAENALASRRGGG